MITLHGLEPKPYPITPEGIRELRAQLAELRLQRRAAAGNLREIASRSTDAGARVDSAYASDRAQADELDARIELLERILAMAEIIRQPASSDVVRLGSLVTLNLGGKRRSYRLVGAVEADPADGKISNESPVGHSLLGKHVNDTIDVASPSGHRTAATVVSIS